MSLSLYRVAVLAVVVAIACADYSALRTLIIDHETYLRELADRVRTAYEGRCSTASRECASCSYDACSGTLPPDVQCATGYAQLALCPGCPNNGIQTSSQHSTVRFPYGDAQTNHAFTQTDAELVCVTESLFTRDDITVQDEGRKNGGAAWVTFGAYTGMLRQYPGAQATVFKVREASACTRESSLAGAWYQAAAVSGSVSRNVVFVIEAGEAARAATSGTYLGVYATRLQCAVNALSGALMALSSNDRVACVIISEDGTPVAYKKTLTRATTQNTGEILIWVNQWITDNVPLGGSSNDGGNANSNAQVSYSRAVQEVYRILADSRTPACASVGIILGTDQSESSDAQRAALVMKMKSLDAGRNVVWFAYSIDANANRASLSENVLNTIACAFGGAYTVFGASTNTMQEYIDAVSTQHARLVAGSVPAAAAASPIVAWGEVVNVYPNYIPLVRASLPVYTTQTTTGDAFLIGVVAADVYFDALVETVSDLELDDTWQSVQQYLWDRVVHACDQPTLTDYVCYSRYAFTGGSGSVQTCPSTDCSAYAFAEPIACAPDEVITRHPLCQPHRKADPGNSCCGLNSCNGERLVHILWQFVFACIVLLVVAKQL